MMERWKKVKLKDITSKLGDGLHGTPKYDNNGEYYFVNGNNLQNGKIIIKEDTKRITKEEYLKIKKQLNDRTILVAINGTLGNIGLYRGEKIALGKSACYFNVNQNVEKQFIRYVIESPLFQMYAQLFATGATIKNLSLKEMRNFSFHLPPLSTQRKIAKILSTYDDLIENNLKRIKLLEEMAQKTYEEWFIRFKFPGHKTAKFDKETGLPEGWEIVKIKDIGKVVTGKTPSTTKPEYFDGNIPFIKTPDMNSYPYVLNTTQYLSEKGANTQKNKYLPKNSVVVSCIGTAGEFALVSRPSQTNQQINAVIFNDEKYSFYFYSFSSFLKPVLEQLGSNGATMTNVNKSKFENIKIIKPSNEILKEYHNLIKPNFDNILNLLNQNQLLKEARDILLPRLMTGVIDIEKIKI